MNIDDMTREEVQAELERRGIDVSKQAERVLAAVRRERACDRCGLPTNQPDLDVVIMRHADPDECIAALKAENERLRAIVDNLPLGVPIGVNDQHGNPIHIGDKLDFDHREWGGPQQFVVELKDGTIQHPGCTSDLSSWCEIIESWDARRVSGE